MESNNNGNIRAMNCVPTPLALDSITYTNIFINLMQERTHKGLQLKNTEIFY